MLLSSKRLYRPTIVETREGKKCQAGYLHNAATVVGVVMQFVVSVSVPLRTSTLPPEVDALSKANNV